MHTGTHSSRLSLTAVLYLMVCVSAFAQVNTDAFDMAQGTTVTYCGGGNCELAAIQFNGLDEPSSDSGKAAAPPDRVE